MNRREFLKAVGTAGVAAGAAPYLMAGQSKPSARAPQPKGETMMDFAAPPLKTVRVGLIGVGARGSGHLAQLMLLEGVEIVAICDNHKPSLDNALAAVVKAGRKPATGYGNGPADYKKMNDRDDIDAVFISTPWELHTPMAVDAMEKGKHAFIEVPAALTVAECWKLVDTSEKTRKHCMMMENVNYGREELAVLNMCRLGIFGELLHAEAAYIHDLRGQMFEVGHGTGSWRTLHYAKRNGNLYPTHGLGPVCHYMGINRGDRMEYMSSVSSPARVREIFAKKNLKDDNPHKNLKFVCGDINTSIVKTAMGKSIMIQWDEQLPRPYNRLNLIQGTNGVWGGFPNRFVAEGLTESTDSWTQGQNLRPITDKYDHPLWKSVAALPSNQGGHGGMDFVMLWRIIYCLRNGLPVDQDVYDAAAWSVIGPLSEWSVANRSQSVDIPDFTRGKWKTGKPVNLSN